jgi:hypothetical protein
VPEHKYDESSVKSVSQYATALTGKSMDEAVQISDTLRSAKSRGELGNLSKSTTSALNKTLISKPISLRRACCSSCKMRFKTLAAQEKFLRLRRK